MIELFTHDFFINAFLISLVLSLLFGLLSFFIVMRKMAFLGAGIAHTAFGGVALGVLAGINPFFTSLLFCATASVLIGKLARHGNVSRDSGIGIFFSFSMALGALFIALGKSYSFDLSGYLFGNILGVTAWDLRLVLLAAIISLPVIFFYFHKILFMSFDEEAALVSGVPVERLDTVLHLLLALVIVISIKIVGIILVSALVVLPASFSAIFFTSYKRAIWAAVVYTVVIMTAGLFLSYLFDTPAGATMVVFGGVVYFMALVIFRKEKFCFPGIRK